MTAPAQRKCGPCKACCSDLRIETPEFNKAADTLCPHHTGTGCGIYARRYKVCREFLCGWRLFPELDDGWRPDLSGVLILQVPQASVPRKYRPAGNGVLFVVIGGEAAINRPGFAAYALALAARGVAIYLATTTPHALANSHLEPVAGDVEAARRTLLHLHRLLAAAAAKKSLVAMLPHLYGLKVERVRSRISGKLKTTNK